MIIHLTTDLFWADTLRLERWPEILLKLPQKINGKNKVDIAKKYLNYRTDKNGRIVKADELSGLFGLEDKNNKKVISGCNFIIKDTDGFYLSDDALRSINSYKQQDAWEMVIVEQLLKYSVRVRALFLALLNSEGIYFKGGFLKNIKEAYVILNGLKYFVFNVDNGQNNLNSIIKEYAKQSLGEYWMSVLKLDETEEIVIQGILNKEPSLKQIGTYFKMPLVLFKHLEWIKEKTPCLYVLDKNKIKQDIDSGIYSSLVLEGLVDQIEILKSLINEYGDIRGYFPVSIVGQILKDKIDPFSDKRTDAWIDKYFLNGIQKGEFKISGKEQGQPRHGRGLMGDKDQQIIKLMF